MPMPTLKTVATIVNPIRVAATKRFIVYLPESRTSTPPLK
jgi:hypothetical protein